MSDTATRKPVADQIFGDNKAPVEEVLTADFADLRKEADDMAAEFKKLPEKIKTEEDQIATGRLIAKARGLSKKIDEIRSREGKPMYDAKKAVDAFFKGIDAIVGREASAAQKAADDYVRRTIEAERARAAREAEEARKKAEAERARAEQAKSPNAAGNASGRAEAYEAKADQLEANAGRSAADLTRARADGVTASARDVWEHTIEDEVALYDSLGPLGHFFSAADVEKAVRSAVRVQKGRTRIPGVKVYPSAKASFRA